MFGFLRRIKEHPRRGVALRVSVELPRRCEAEGPERHPSATLRRSVAVLRRDVGTVHRGKIFGFCFRAPRICAPIVGGPNK